MNDTGRAIFVRDAKGELVTVLPGEQMPAIPVQAASDDSKGVVEKAEAHFEEERLANRSVEDEQYDVYLASKKNKGGNVWIPNAGQASSDRAAFVDSMAADMAKDAAERSGKEYKPSRAYDRGAKVKHQKTGGGATYGGASASDAAIGAAKAQEAMARALEASDDDEEEGSLSMNAVQLANRSMEWYNVPISNLAQRDVYGNDLRQPKLQRKGRKFLECFAEDICGARPTPPSRPCSARGDPLHQTFVQCAQSRGRPSSRTLRASRSATPPSSASRGALCCHAAACLLPCRPVTQGPLHRLPRVEVASLRRRDCS